MTGPVEETMLESAAWETAVLAAERQQQWVQAARWASCLHRLGRCEEAVTVLRQTPAATTTSQAVAAILCIRLLKQCGCEERAGAVWSTLETTTTPVIRRQALGELLNPANNELNQTGTGDHGTVCGYHRCELPEAVGQPRRFDHGS
ncbi:hypothetical protein [Actinoplanes sp. NPDC049802]|uniref:hypothetical protein n=1 Tax=Actinoplanes sp. NPDC049802 TaxID=3154742 RepID=UPI0033CC6FC8